MRANFPINAVPEKHARDVCRIGQGALCCRYLVMGGEGYECEKLGEMRVELDRRSAAPSWSAKADNCPGMG